jgi:hypothetical protein
LCRRQCRSPLARFGALALAREGAGPGGLVEQRTYFGDEAEYLVRVGADLIQTVQWNPSAQDEFRVGQHVSLKLPTSDVQLLSVD